MSNFNPLQENRVLLVLAVTYSLFLVYGTIIPIDVRYESFVTIWSGLWDPASYQLQFSSVQNLVAGFILFVPFSFFWIAVWEYRLKPVIFIRYLVMSFCFLLGVFLELVQIFAPGNHFDLMELMVTVAGGGAGLFVWHQYGQQIVSRISDWQYEKGLTGVASQVLFFYLAVLVLYQWLPLDFVFETTDIIQDIKQGKLVWIPFTGGDGPWIGQLHRFSIEFSIWTFIGVLWLYSSELSAIRIWLKVIIFAALLEFSQLLVHSRYSDMTDVFCAITGAGFGIRLGLVLMRRFPLITKQNHHQYRRAWTLVGFVVFLFWLFLIIWAAWFPFNFTFLFDSGKDFAVTNIPFWSGNNGGKHASWVHVLNTFLFFSPLGSMLGFMAAWLDKRRVRRHALEIALLILLVVAVVLEIGHHFLPMHRFEPVRIILALIAGALGYAVIFQLQMRYRLQLEKGLHQGI